MRGLRPGLEAEVELAARVAPGARDARQQSRYSHPEASLRCRTGEPGTCAFKLLTDPLHVRDLERRPGLEIRDGGLAQRHRGGEADGSLESPAEPRHEVERLARQRAEDESGAHDGEDLEGAVETDLLAVGGGDLEDHADLVGGHRRHVGAGDDDHDADDRVLRGVGEHHVVAVRAAHRRQASGQRCGAVAGGVHDAVLEGGRAGVIAAEAASDLVVEEPGLAIQPAVRSLDEGDDLPPARARRARRRAPSPRPRSRPPRARRCPSARRAARRAGSRPATGRRARR